MVMQNIINFLEYYFYLFLFLYYTIISILIIWIIKYNVCQSTNETGWIYNTTCIYLNKQLNK